MRRFEIVWWWIIWIFGFFIIFSVNKWNYYIFSTISLYTSLLLFLKYSKTMLFCFNIYHIFELKNNMRISQVIDRKKYEYVFSENYQKTMKQVFDHRKSKKHYFKFMKKIWYQHQYRSYYNVKKPINTQNFLQKIFINNKKKKQTKPYHISHNNRPN